MAVPNEATKPENYKLADGYYSIGLLAHFVRFLFILL